MRIVSLESFYNKTHGFLKLTCEDGSFGWGQYSPYEVQISSEILHDLLTRVLFDCDADAVEATIESCERDKFLFKYKGGFFYRALCAVDTALWDRLGRQEGVPVCRLLGGAPQPVAVYASSLRRDTTIEEEVDRFHAIQQETGITAFKFKIAIPGGRDADVYPGKSEAYIEAMAEAFPTGANRLIADANGGLTAEKAIEIGKRLRDHGFSAFEEPTFCWEMEAARRVQSTGIIPVMGMEQEYDLDRWKILIDSRALGVVEPDIGYLGGITRTRKVLEMAVKAGLPVSYHASNPSWLLHFSAHLMNTHASTMPLIEYGIESNPWLEGSYGPEPVIRDGAFCIDDIPGWGVEPNAKWLESAQYRRSCAPSKTRPQ